MPLGDGRAVISLDFEKSRYYLFTLLNWNRSIKITVIFPFLHCSNCKPVTQPVEQYQSGDSSSLVTCLPTGKYALSYGN